MRGRATAVLVALLLGAVLAPPAVAQDPASSSTTVAVPAQDIVPAPNTDSPPSEAGDRGGGLQLGLLGVVVLVIGGSVARLVRQSRRARGIG